MRYGLFYAHKDLIIRHSPVLCFMADKTDVDFGHYANSDLEDEVEVGVLKATEASAPKSL